MSDFFEHVRKFIPEHCQNLKDFEVLKTKHKLPPLECSELRRFLISIRFIKLDKPQYTMDPTCPRLADMDIVEA